MAANQNPWNGRFVKDTPALRTCLFQVARGLLKHTALRVCPVVLAFAPVNIIYFNLLYRPIVFRAPLLEVQPIKLVVCCIRIVPFPLLGVNLEVAFRQSDLVTEVHHTVHVGRLRKIQCELEGLRSRHLFISLLVATRLLGFRPPNVRPFNHTFDILGNSFLCGIWVRGSVPKLAVSRPDGRAKTLLVKCASMVNVRDVTLHHAGVATQRKKVVNARVGIAHHRPSTRRPRIVIFSLWTCDVAHLPHLARDI
jgi:hypothetical protein